MCPAWKERRSWRHLAVPVARPARAGATDAVARAPGPADSTAYGTRPSRPTDSEPASALSCRDRPALHNHRRVADAASKGQVPCDVYDVHSSCSCPPSHSQRHAPRPARLPAAAAAAPPAVRSSRSAWPTAARTTGRSTRTRLPPRASRWSSSTSPTTTSPIPRCRRTSCSSTSSSTCSTWPTTTSRTTTRWCRSAQPPSTRCRCTRRSTPPWTRSRRAARSRSRTTRPTRREPCWSSRPQS